MKSQYKINDRYIVIQSLKVIKEEDVLPESIDKSSRFQIPTIYWQKQKIKTTYVGTINNCRCPYGPTNFVCVQSNNFQILQ